MEIIPAILAKDESDFIEKINYDFHQPMTLQIDILDGSLFNASSWHQPSAIPKDLTNNLELHLMVSNPEVYLDSWLQVDQVRRVYIHSEIDLEIQPIINKVRKRNLQIGLAISPDTSINDIEYYISDLDAVLVMGVEPGASGRPFIGELALEKIRQLRSVNDNLFIAIDGGVDLQNTPDLLQAGANALCIGSRIWSQGEPLQNYLQFQQKTQNLPY